MTSLPQPTENRFEWGPLRTGPADRRLGERRLQLAPVATDRRGHDERRRPVGRRESVSGHIRNAIQVLESAIEVAEHDGLGVERDTLLAVLVRMRSALNEADRLASDRSHLGRLLRVSERGLPPAVLPGLQEWPR